MNRDEMIEFLVDNDCYYIMNRDYTSELLKNKLRDGFKGYTNFTDSDLEREYDLRQRIGEYN